MAGDYLPSHSLAFTVILCTHNRVGMLSGCIESILADLKGGLGELIVVDNASSDGTSALIESRIDEADIALRLLQDNRLGKSYALNTGIAAAQGEILLFTDDDVIVEAGWSAALMRAFADSSVGAVAGRIQPEWLAPPPRWLLGPHARMITLIDMGNEPRELGPAELPFGANMAIRRAALGGRADPFDVHLGHRGRTVMAYEEVRLITEIRRDWRIVYEPQAVLRHRILPERAERSALRVAYFQTGFGNGRNSRRQGAQLGSLKGRARGATLAFLRALSWSLRNRREVDLSPAAANRELTLYSELGWYLERICAKHETFAEWLSESVGPLLRHL